MSDDRDQLHIIMRKVFTIESALGLDFDEDADELREDIKFIKNLRAAQKDEVTLTAARYRKYQDAEITLEAIIKVLEARGYTEHNAAGIAHILDHLEAVKAHNESLEHELACYMEAAVEERAAHSQFGVGA